MLNLTVLEWALLALTILLAFSSWQSKRPWLKMIWGVSFASALVINALQMRSTHLESQKLSEAKNEIVKLQSQISTSKASTAIVARTTAQSYSRLQKDFEIRQAEDTAKLHVASSKLAQIEYSEMATLDYEGNRDLGGISTPGPLGGWTKGYVLNNNPGIKAKIDDEAIAYYEDLCRKNPKFPFYYWVLSDALRLRGEKRWRTTAKEAISILKITTAIPGHSRHHDQILETITKTLAENP